jgi:hypothetical protein
MRRKSHLETYTINVLTTALLSILEQGKEKFCMKAHEKYLDENERQNVIVKVVYEEKEK